MGDSYEVLVLLLEHGADPNVRFQGRSPVDFLIDYESNDTAIELMLKMGARS